ncbi:gag-int-pol protein [Lasius niger]|uniref:Gag-int-pol protein n=1 Tax=Lasius niger TaxID=67767 RepID=A0A0J7K098_LASNI|nr:gag-int-pol protein [Lasius niger]
MIRTLVEKARAMLLESKLSKKMWGEAILCAAYLINRSLTSSLKGNVTPAEMFYGNKPNLKNLKIFRCLAYYCIPKQRLEGKFNSKGEACIMIGYTHNGYRLWNPIHRKLVIARNIFDERKNIEDIEEKTVNMKTTWLKSEDEQAKDTEKTDDEEFVETLSKFQNSTEEET